MMTSLVFLAPFCFAVAYSDLVAKENDGVQNVTWNFMKTTCTCSTACHNGNCTRVCFENGRSVDKCSFQPTTCSCKTVCADGTCRLECRQDGKEVEWEACSGSNSSFVPSVASHVERLMKRYFRGSQPTIALRGLSPTTGAAETQSVQKLFSSHDEVIAVSPSTRWISAGLAAVVAVAACGAWVVSLLKARGGAPEAQLALVAQDADEPVLPMRAEMAE
eukprot:TRINITY_DN50940_c0_g1_i1.p1 TRINITY_DN50940_c0_g1~~TRINITY_DN50940_c0_g1_i1.p1  ORF type:complete len:227 (-),score=40.56 TRINITY_DN50940_c0_g1_i1:73-729(-)